MLPEPAVPPSLMRLLEKLGTFTSPSLRTFGALLTGLVAASGKRTVTGMLTAAGLSRAWSQDRAHVFFSRAAWNPEVLGLALSHLIVRMLLPQDVALTVAVDDTLFKRYGKHLWCGLADRGHLRRGPRPARGRAGPKPHRYATKTEPSLSDMPAKLRRVIIAARFLPTTPGQPTYAEIRAVHQARASASHDLAA